MRGSVDVTKSSHFDTLFTHLFTDILLIMMQNQNTQSKLSLLANKGYENNLLDKSTFETLISETSNDVVWDILDAFKPTLQVSIATLEHTQLRTSEAHNVCHKLKGSSLLIGFIPLGEFCKAAMGEMNNCPPEDFEKTIKNVLDCARDTQRIVK